MSKNESEQGRGICYPAVHNYQTGYVALRETMTEFVAGIQPSEAKSVLHLLFELFEAVAFDVDELNESSLAAADDAMKQLACYGSEELFKSIGVALRHGRIGIKAAGQTAALLINLVLLGPGEQEARLVAEGVRLMHEAKVNE